MPPWVSIILPLHSPTSDQYAKIIFPIDALTILRTKTNWCWIPQLGDATSDGGGDSLLTRAGIHTRPSVDILNNVWDFINV